VAWAKRPSRWYRLYAGKLVPRDDLGLCRRGRTRGAVGISSYLRSVLPTVIIGAIDACGFNCKAASTSAGAGWRRSVRPIGILIASATIVP
jgi:hypothetical protein